MTFCVGSDRGEVDGRVAVYYPFVELPQSYIQTRAFCCA